MNPVMIVGWSGLRRSLLVSCPARCGHIETQVTPTTVAPAPVLRDGQRVVEVAERIELPLLAFHRNEEPQLQPVRDPWHQLPGCSAPNHGGQHPWRLTTTCRQEAA